MTFAELSAAERARWRRRTSGPAEPIFSTGLAPSLSSETQCRGANFGCAPRARELIQAWAAATVASSYVPEIGPSYAPFSLSRHWRAGTTLLASPGLTAG